MGSFNATCIASGLPIEAGTPVRFLALTESEYHRSNEHCCYVTGRFQPRTAPIRAEYNDYGSVEDIQESLTTEVFFKSFDQDVIEKGVGDNQCHDVQVRKGMSQEQWLEALWEGRVFVGHGSGIPWNSTSEKLPEGLPTLARIEKVLKDAHLPVVIDYGAKGFVLDDVAYGYLRVRNSGYLEAEVGKRALGDALFAIRAADYAAMITCGSGNYSREDGEILVAPMPGRALVNGLNPTEHRKPERPVSQAMVREDVWQILLGMTLPSWGEKTYTFEGMREAARKAVVEHREYLKELRGNTLAAAKKAIQWELREHHGPDGNLFLACLRGSEGVSGFYFKQAFQLGWELAKSDAELEGFVDDLAEMIFVQMAYASLHGQWHPTTNSGQDGNWEGHREFLLKLAQIKGKWEEENEDEVVVSPEMQALIRWRSEQVLDFSDDEEYFCKVSHGLTTFYRDNHGLIPDEHRPAYREFMGLSELGQKEAIEVTLGIGEDEDDEETD